MESVMDREHADVVAVVKPPVWTEAKTAQLDSLWCVEVDLVLAETGQHCLKVTAYNKDEEPIDYPLLRGLFPAGNPSMIPTDCPLPLWLAYSAVAQAVEWFVNTDSEFTLG